MSGFARTLVYGAAASAALPLAVLVGTPLLVSAPALGLFAVFAVAGYLTLLASGARQRVGVACASLAVGLAAWLASGSLFQLLLLLSLGVAAMRSGVLFRRGAARAAVVEGVVCLGSLWAAGTLAGPGLVGSALALWGWFVVQSAALALGDLRRRRRPGPGDPFDVARRNLEELLSG